MSGFFQSEVSFALFFCLLSLVVILAPLRIGYIFRMIGGIVFVTSFYYLMMAIPEIYGRPRPLESIARVAKDMWIDGFIADKHGVLGEGPSIYLWGRKNADAIQEPSANQEVSENRFSIGDLLSKIEKIISEEASLELGPISYVIPYDEKIHKLLEKERSRHKGKSFRIEVKTQTSKKNSIGAGEQEIFVLPIKPVKTK